LNSTWHRSSPGRLQFGSRQYMLPATTWSRSRSSDRQTSEGSRTGATLTQGLTRAGQAGAGARPSQTGLRGSSVWAEPRAEHRSAGKLLICLASDEHTHTHTQKHAHTHTQTYTYSLTHAHTHAHTFALSLSLSLSCSLSLWAPSGLCLSCLQIKSHSQDMRARV
jgi:hypothetical protein